MKIINVEEAVKLIQDNDMVGITGAGGCGSPENLLCALRERYEKEGHPRNIGVTCGITPGNMTEEYVGFNNLALDGMVGKAICGHLGRGKLFGECVANSKFPAYTIPLGVYGHLLRAIAGKKDGIITHVGLQTFCDPRLEGCKANTACDEDIVELLNINGKEQLFYKSYPINVALIKATYADEDGNVSLCHEPIIAEQVELASAVHACGGIVICEVEKIVPKKSILPKNVDIFQKIVDYVVVGEPRLDLGEYNFPVYKPELIGEEKVELSDLEIIPLNERKICGRRASLELEKDQIVNCGIGMPDTIGRIASEEGFYDKIYITIETGVFGGVPVYGQLFGAAINPISLYSMANIFDLYDGGIIDVGVVGVAEVDKYGNVNVSKLGTRTTGPGGFINITQNCKKAIFMGTFTSSGLEVEIKDGELKIIKEGKHKKFLNNVNQVTFASKYAHEKKQDVIYITERCVFTLNEEGLLELTEIAPGIDIERDILPNMDFVPVISKNLKTMDLRIFKDEKMNIGEKFN